MDDWGRLANDGPRRPSNVVSPEIKTFTNISQIYDIRAPAALARLRLLALLKTGKEIFRPIIGYVL